MASHFQQQQINPLQVHVITDFQHHDTENFGWEFGGTMDNVVFLFYSNFFSLSCYPFQTQPSATNSF